MIKLFNHYLYRGYEVIALSAFSLLALIVGWQVVARYLFNNSPSWSEPLAMLLLLIAVLLGSACGIAKGFHLNLVFFTQHMPAKAQLGSHRIAAMVVVLLGLAMINYGGQMALQTARYSIPGLPLSMASQYLPLVFAGFGFISFSLENLLTGPATTTSITEAQ